MTYILEHSPENFTRRESGLIVPLSTIVGDDHRGTYGPEYVNFLEIMQSAGFKNLHDLPLNPPDEHNCPYSSVSTFAIDPQRIDLEGLVAAGDISMGDLDTYLKLVSSRDTGPAIKLGKEKLLGKAFEQFDDYGSPERKAEFAEWRANEAEWLGSYAAFEVAKKLPQNKDKRWQDWGATKDYSPQLVNELRASYGLEFSKIAYMQWIAEKQHLHYLDVAHTLGIHVWGDIPFYVGDGDVWASREIFNLDSDGNQLDQGGAAKSKTSETGQIWGNATYKFDPNNSKASEATVDWWVKRLLRAHKLNPDSVRLDHFIGYAEPFIIPIDAVDGLSGRRVEGIGRMVLDKLVEKLGSRSLPYYPEDLGTQTKATGNLRDEYGLLGSTLAVRTFGKELTLKEFAEYLGAPNNPDRYNEQTVAFSGNHDTPTLIQAIKDIRKSHPEALRRYIKHVAQKFPDKNLDQYPSIDKLTNKHIEELASIEIERVIRSAAQYAFLPLGDLYHYGEKAQFNKPGIVDLKNWRWRMSDKEVRGFRRHAGYWRELNVSSTRSPRLDN